VMMVDGQLYPLHVAISRDWKIHYYTADMADHAHHRAEDAAFLENMPAVLGPHAMTALKQIQSTLKLDYGGIDFGLNERGEVLLFEANATMAVVVPGKDECWDYRRPATEQIYIAVWKMLMNRAQGKWSEYLRAEARRSTDKGIDRSAEEKPEEDSLWSQWENYADQQHLIHRYSRIGIDRSNTSFQPCGRFTVVRSRFAETDYIVQYPEVS
jgi:hypothetical protein